MTSTLKNVYIDRLDDIVNKDNNTYHRTIKMKPLDLKPTTYFDFNKENNKEGPKFKVGNNVRISKYKNIFAKGYVPNWPKFKNTVPWTYVVSGLNGEETELLKINQKEFRVEKVIKKRR